MTSVSPRRDLLSNSTPNSSSMLDLQEQIAANAQKLVEQEKRLAELDIRTSSQAEQIITNTHKVQRHNEESEENTQRIKMLQRDYNVTSRTNCKLAILFVVLLIIALGVLIGKFA